MLGKKISSEKTARQMLDDHINKVGEVLSKTLATLKCYFNDQIAEAKICAREVDRLETEADDILRGFMVCLQDGAFMPLIRKDIFQVISASASVQVWTVDLKRGRVVSWSLAEEDMDFIGD